MGCEESTSFSGCSQAAQYLIEVAAELATAINDAELEPHTPASWERDEDRRTGAITHWCTPAQVRQAMARLSGCLRDFSKIIEAIDQTHLAPEALGRLVTSTGGVPEKLTERLESDVEEERLARAERAGYSLALIALLERGNVVLATDFRHQAPFLIARTLLVDPSWGDARVRPRATALTTAMAAYHRLDFLRGWRAWQVLAEAGYAPAPDL